MTNTTKPKIVFISESIRQDNHAPLLLFDNFEIVHLYLKAPYGDMGEGDFKFARKVDLPCLKDEIIKENPDFLQGAEPFGSRMSLKLASICLSAAHQTGAKLIVPIFENRSITDRFNLVQRAVLRAFCPGYFKAAIAIICLNLGAAKNVKHYFENAKIVTGLPWGVWGVDLKRFKPVAKKVPGKIIYVGRLVEEKGLNYLFEAFLNAQNKNSNLSLQICGTGDMEETLRLFVKENNIGNKVEFVGVVKNRELPAYFSSAELCVYPSITTKRWEEQVGTVNFQAMACSTPVLTTKSGAISEYLEDGKGAKLVEERNSKALEEFIIKFFSDDELKKTLTQDAKEAMKKYDVRLEVKKAQDLLEKILKG